MHVVVAGSEDGPLVLLLHGFSEFWYIWRYQIQALGKAGFRVVAPDQRGHNLTDKRARMIHIPSLAMSVISSALSGGAAPTLWATTGAA
jgi:pimeloyl-ACP methyl ester carboxylesterase